MTHVSAETKKNDFRGYLEKSNVIDAMTKALVSLYEEPTRPENPIEYIQKRLGGRTEAEYSELLRQLDEAKEEVMKLKGKLENRSA
jgi:hypothetical protein